MTPHNEVDYECVTLSAHQRSTNRGFNIWEVNMITMEKLFEKVLTKREENTNVRKKTYTR